MCRDKKYKELQLRRCSSQRKLFCTRKMTGCGVMKDLNQKANLEAKIMELVPKPSLFSYVCLAFLPLLGPFY